MKTKLTPEMGAWNKSEEKRFKEWKKVCNDYVKLKKKERKK